MRRLPRPLFYLSARLFGEACLELFIWRYTPAGRKQVYLIPRPEGDPFYGGLLHLPGVRKIPWETDEEHVARALEETPFHPLRVDVRDMVYLFSNTYHPRRGADYVDVRGLRVGFHADEPDFYDVDALPVRMIAYQRDVIRRACELTR